MRRPASLQGTGLGANEAQSRTAPCRVRLNLAHHAMSQLLARRQQRIAEAAYLRAEHRRVAPGLELDDWLAAERQVDAADAPIALD